MGKHKKSYSFLSDNPKKKSLICSPFSGKECHALARCIYLSEIV